MTDRASEWLEADGLGGFASGTALGIRTRRYHALLLAAVEPPAGRFVLVNGVEAWIERDGRAQALSSQHYSPDVMHPDGASRIDSFTIDPWPTWTFRLDGARVVHEVLTPHGHPCVVLTWRLEGEPRGARLVVRPLMSGRDPHALQHENGAFRFEPERAGDGALRFRPYDGGPAVVASGNGTYHHHPDWYRSFFYEEEAARGLDAVEDLASPGRFEFDLSSGPALLSFAAEAEGLPATRILSSRAASELQAAERSRRAGFGSRLHRAADAYLVRRGSGKTIVAGYPWFGDWGRDTFIALRGLCISGGRLDDAAAILGEWASAVSRGMLPNRFPDRGDVPEYNSVDASLWYVVAVHDYLEASARAGRSVGTGEGRALRAAVEAILEGYSQGTRYGIRADDDGLLAAGEAGVQLTWMDAKVGDWVVTPRIGKPVEVQALWLNALRSAGASSPRWHEPFERGLRSFRGRFWNEALGCLYDVVDVDHERGRDDAAFRPNQIFAVGGLPFALLDGPRARSIVDAVERRLATPLGLRSLAPGEPDYAPRYEGGVRDRDGSYHQGTVWPWLAGPFVEAWVRVRGGTEAAKSEARSRFLTPLLAHLDEAGLGHLSEIADADAPHRPRGCPFQAWSVGEALRLSVDVLARAERLLERGSPA